MFKNISRECFLLVSVHRFCYKSSIIYRLYTITAVAFHSIWFLLLVGFINLEVHLVNLFVHFGFIFLYAILVIKEYPQKTKKFINTDEFIIASYIFWQDSQKMAHSEFIMMSESVEFSFIIIYRFSLLHGDFVYKSYVQLQLDSDGWGVNTI